MNIGLTTQLEAMVRQKVESGLYNNASEVVWQALRLMAERDRREWLRAAIAIGDEQFARGENTTWTAETMQRLIQEAEEDDRQGRPIHDDVLP